MTYSDDYHDYFIKDGNFIGEFEEMYQRCADPWLQDSSPGWWEEIALLMLEKYSYRRVLDLGCGKGRLSDRLRSATGAAVTALDIAPTAIRIARRRYPEVDFIVSSAATIPFAIATFDLVVSSQLLWCTIPELNRIFAEVKRVLRPGGHYLIMQTYYPAGMQHYATDVMTTPDDLLQMLPFKPLHTVELDRARAPQFVGLMRQVP